MITKESNLESLLQKIQGLMLSQNTIIAFDFDELLVPIQLTKKVMRQISAPVNEGHLDQLGSCSFEGIEYLNSLSYGRSTKEYFQTIERVVGETSWRDGCDDLLMSLSPVVDVVIISSGVADVCWEMMRRIGFERARIFGAEFHIAEEELSDSRLIISDELKGIIVQQLKKNHRVVAVGHGPGDKYMIECADYGVVYNPSASGLSSHIARTIRDIDQMIRRFIR